jgi:hypothetical protein
MPVGGRAEKCAQREMRGGHRSFSSGAGLRSIAAQNAVSERRPARRRRGGVAGGRREASDEIMAKARMVADIAN